MLRNARVWIGSRIIRLGMAIVPAGVRRMAINMIMYHVPGALSEDQKAEIRALAGEYRQTRT